MGSSDLFGKSLPQVELFPYSHLLRCCVDRKYDYWLQRRAFVESEAFAGLVKEISKGDLSIESAIFRVWGIRK